MIFKRKTTISNSTFDLKYFTRVWLTTGSTKSYCSLPKLSLTTGICRKHTLLSDQAPDLQRIISNLHFHNSKPLENKLPHPSKNVGFKKTIRQYLCDLFVRKGEKNFRLQDSDFTNQQRTVDVIRSYGYPAEEFSVTTEDGYVLTLTRIRSAGTKMPVLMIHGVLAASDQWVLRGPQEDLAFILADEGHDVWLADQRGNTFSRKHQYLNTSEEDYWDFSFHETGLYDLPAFIDTVLHYSRSGQLLYVGHSMGTTVYYVLCSLRPEYNQLIHTAVHLSPVAFGLNKTLSPLLSMTAANADNIAEAFRKQKLYEFMPRNPRSQKLVTDLGSNKAFSLFLVNQLYGPTSMTNTTKMMYYVSKLMAGTSLKTMMHLVQIYKTKHSNFEMFDYGKVQNYERYKSKSPPTYPLELVNSPVALFYSDRDVFLDNESVARLASHLPNVVAKTSFTKMNHIDLIFADEATRVLYKKVVKLFSAKP